MALGAAGKLSLLLALPGVLAFTLGIIAENKKPTGDQATQVVKNGVISCVYPKDLTPVLGSLAVVFLFITAVIAVVSLVFPYEGKRVPLKALGKSKSLVTFFVLSVLSGRGEELSRALKGGAVETGMWGFVNFVVTTKKPSKILFLVAEALLLWATILESVHRKQNQHSAALLKGSCPTAKAGLFGGAAFLALDSTLFWLICVMLTLNVRADHFGYDDEDLNGKYGDVTAADYSPALGAHITPKV